MSTDLNKELKARGFKNLKKLDNFLVKVDNEKAYNEQYAEDQDNEIENLTSSFAQLYIESEEQQGAINDLIRIIISLSNENEELIKENEGWKQQATTWIEALLQK